MKTKNLLTVILLLGFSLVLRVPLLHAQGTVKNLALVYSNNINGEVDPCPT